MNPAVVDAFALAITGDWTARLSRVPDMTGRSGRADSGRGRDKSMDAIRKLLPALAPMCGRQITSSRIGRKRSGR